MLWLMTILRNKMFLWLLLLVNVFGTIYGYIWYIPQLRNTPPQFLLFVPDSPTASLFFCFVLIAFILKRNWPIFEVLAIITLFKYGVWAVIMNLLTLMVSGDLPWEGYMLMASHAAMAVQGILYSSFYRVKLWHIAAGAVWTVHNDIIDYVYMQFPVYSRLYMYIQNIGYFTFWLSIISIAIAYYFTQKTNRLSLDYKFD
ncbi:DUF1405 domain-containing protein [Rossellomorea vietnamensis]|uniref:DUF1405 domain-containing protein n=1 Tax=Rossellomorea vietnamensis TaxID=218284 RepID=A0A0P6WUG9_9BACI|nr:DUF1405 domain-containing protein [Rossellomorea vietnamensis]KPL59788.1 hypothetical protein AM506_10035 [Rossellomorea vietnamensis]